ncbi:MAG: FKBP-type peptidyl-prolyl cis-trans isomerase [Saprospiraceae bacterium]
MQKHLFVLSLLLLLCWSCQESNPVKKASEAVLVERLSKDLVANPKTQAEIERNVIINHAIDQGYDVQPTASGIYYQIITPGKGSHPGMTDMITANYKGSFLNGKEFDSSYSAGKPLEFTLNSVIKGWQEVIPMLKPGGSGLFIIPSHYAYGERGFPNFIPPNSPLVFKIELISFDLVDDF